MERKQSDVVIIKWADSYGVSTDWEFKDDLKPQRPVTIISIGFIEEETDEYITVYQNDSDMQISGRITIPKCCILQIHKCKSINYIIKNWDKITHEH